MIEKFYLFLQSIGYTHPVHPALVHIPMGMVIGMTFFSLVGCIWKSRGLDRTSHHCAVLALIFILPTMLAGYMDWQYFRGGEWVTLIIIKMVLAVLLAGLLTGVVIAKHRGVRQGRVVLLYLLCFACAVGLGYCGGDLVY